MTIKVCIICGESVKAKQMCAKHHQRFMRSGTPYLKNEKVDNPIDIASYLKTEKEKTKVDLSMFYS